MFSTLLGSFSASFRMYATIAIIAVVVLAAGGLYWKFSSMQSTIEKIEKQNKELENDKAVLSKVNSENQITIEKMKQDVIDRDKAVNDFRIQKARDDKKLNDLGILISKYGKNEDGPIAKVLRDAILGLAPEKKEKAK